MPPLDTSAISTAIRLELDDEKDIILGERFFVLQNSMAYVKVWYFCEFQFHWNSIPATEEFNHSVEYLFLAGMGFAAASSS